MRVSYSRRMTELSPNSPVVVAATRTAITDAYRGSLAPVGVRDLASRVVTEAIERAGIDPVTIDDLVLGEVLQGGGCIARYTAIAAGLPEDTPGLALNRQCATGLTAVATAAANIASGMDRVVVAGGAESLTQMPITYAKAAYPWGVPEQFISPSHPDRPDAPNMNMTVTVGENTVAELGLSRRECDEWALTSHERAVAAIDEGRFKSEIVPVEVTGADGQPRAVEVDEHPRRTTSLEKLSSLPVISGVADGTVTAGNSSPINDGAAALVLMSAQAAQEAGVEPLRAAEVVGSRGRRPGQNRPGANGRHPQGVVPRRDGAGRHRPVRGERSLRLHDSRNEPCSRARSPTGEPQRRCRRGSVIPSGPRARGSW